MACKVIEDRCLRALPDSAGVCARRECSVIRKVDMLKPTKLRESCYWREGLTASDPN
jgi:hypothetical protein